MPVTLAIIGRPNVGKSTLFNRLVGRRVAIVDDTSGVTRDRQIATGRIGPLALSVIDTAGLEEAFDDSLEGRMRRQTERALGEADVAVLVIDARAGVTPLDRAFARWIRRQPVPVLLVANKCEGRAADAGLTEAWELGLGEPISLSAEHGIGMAALVEALLPFERTGGQAKADPELTADLDIDVVEDAEADEEDGPEVAEGEDDGRPIQLAVVGRPNVGKSTLVNALLEEDRVLTGPEAGITRDAISVDWSWADRPITLVDTAGMRRKARIEDRLEKASVGDTLGTLRMAQVVVLVLDGTLGLERQDLTIARHVIDEGRVLVIAVNKWDAVADRDAAMAGIRDRIETSLAQVRGVPVVPISALRGQRLDRLMTVVVETYRIWNRRVKTGPLNRWLAQMLEQHPPPVVQGRRLKLRYMTQVKGRPPTFAVFTTRPAELPDSYLRYLTNGLRDRFGFDGVPIRLLMRKGKNPYAGR